MSTSFFLLIAMILGGLLTESGWFIPLIFVFSMLAIRDAFSGDSTNSGETVANPDPEDEAVRIAVRVAQIRKSLNS